MKFYPEGHLIDKAENKAGMQTPAALSDAMRDGKILEARSIICDNEHNLIVDLKCMRGIIPREEGALGIREGTVRDIAIISRVNKPVCFIITDFIRDAFGRITAVLSRRKAQERCMAEYIAGLTLRRCDPGAHHAFGAVRCVCGYRLRYCFPTAHRCHFCFAHRPPEGAIHGRHGYSRRGAHEG